MKLTERFASLAAAQQMGYFPNFEYYFFKAFEKKAKITHKTKGDMNALRYADKFGKPYAAMKSGQTIKMIWL
jgi:hypothetical protein